MKQKGQLLVELLLAIAIAGLVLPALFSGIATAREGRGQQQQRVEGVNLLRSTNEAVRSIREKGWATFAVNGTYHPVISGNSWDLSAGAETVDDFTRQIVISSVERDANGAIVPNGGTVDPSTKQVVTTVSWSKPIPASINSTLLLTRYLENASYTETTQTQFNAGTKTGLIVRATSGSGLADDDGELILSPGGHGDWCDPILGISSINLTGGIATSVTAKQGSAYIGTGQNASGLPFINVGITNANPPVATEVGTSTLGYKTNAVFGEGNYGYLATDTNSEEVVVINLAASPPYPKAGSFNAPGNGNGLSVFVSGSYGYMTTTSGNKLYNFNKPGNSLPLDSDGVALSGTGNKVYVVGNYAYIALSNNTYEMDIIDLTTPTNLVRIGRIDIDSLGAKDVVVSTDGNRAYLVTGLSATQSEFFIINTSTKSSPQLVLGGTFDTGLMDPRGVSIAPGNYAILVGWNGERYQVLNIGSESSITKRCGLSPTFNINGIAAVQELDGDVYAYVVTDDSSGEFKIIEGDAGGQYSTTGTFESQTFNRGYVIYVNNFSALFLQPSGTTIKFQVSLATMTGNPPACPSTENYTFIGPDSENPAGSYFTPTNGQIVSFPFLAVPPNYINPGQCFRYKAYLSTTNGTSTPVLNEVTINYSP